MKIYLVLLAACVPLGYFGWEAIEKSRKDAKAVLEGREKVRVAWKQIETAREQALSISKMDDAVIAGALGLRELPDAPAVPPDAETKRIHDNFEAHSKAMAASRAFVDAFPTGNVPDAQVKVITKDAPKGVELKRLLENRKDHVLPLENGIKDLIARGETGPGSQLEQALPAYAKQELADMALVALAWSLVDREWPPPDRPLRGSRLVLILKTSDLVDDAKACKKISQIFNGLNQAVKDSLVTGKFVLVTKRDKARVQQWPGPEHIGTSNDAFARGEYQIAFEAAAEEATKLRDRRVSGQPELKVHLIWRSDEDVPPRGSGGVVNGMGGLDVELQWIAPGNEPKKGILSGWFRRGVNAYDWTSAYEVDLANSLAN